MKPRGFLWIVIILVVLAVFFDLPKLPGSISIPKLSLPVNKQIPATKFEFASILDHFPVRLGLDLQGGTQLVLQTDMSKIAVDQKDTALESSRQVIERRVNLFGVSESLVQSSKIGDTRRILVDLPGIKDASAAAELVGKTAQLDFREKPATFSGEQMNSGLPPVFFFNPTGLTGADLKKAQITYGSGNKTNTSPQVAIQFTDTGAKKFEEITRRNIGQPLAIFLDDQPVSLNPPIVQQEIIGGNAVISGNFTTEEAKKLTTQLNAGALPVPIKIIEQRSIGASLGRESINKSVVAALIGILTVMIYMAIFYGVYGLIADLALIIYTIFVLAIFKTGFFVLPPVTLTLAGIAGFILSVGMAVDANILIFERMKEERRWGKSKVTALDLGFRRAWSSIRDSNISSLLTAGILYFMGTGLVRGFAITLAVGVLVSMFTAVVVTRTFLRMLIR